MKLTKEIILTIPKLRLEGKTIPEIASTLGMSTNAINYWIKRLKKAGHTVSKSPRVGRPALDLGEFETREANEPLPIIDTTSIPTG